MEDNLKILKAEYLSNYWSDFPEILNLSSGGQQQKNTQKKRQLLMEDDLKILKLGYLSNHWLDFPKILNF